MRVLIAVPLAALALGTLLFGCTPPPAPVPVAVVIPPTPEPPGQNAPVCVRPAEKAAFEMSTLKSHLTVTAIQCKEEDRYNAFVLKYRPDLVGSEKVLSGYFSRAYGGRAQRQQDDFITQLANAQSQFAVRSGNLYCPQNVGIFESVMAVKSGTDLPAFVADKPIQHALAVQDCPTAPPPAVRKKP